VVDLLERLQQPSHWEVAVEVDPARVRRLDAHQSSPPAAALGPPILSAAVSTALTMFW
jgi:hypothetical protein